MMEVNWMIHGFTDVTKIQFTATFVDGNSRSFKNSGSSNR